MTEVRIPNRVEEFKKAIDCTFKGGGTEDFSNKVCMVVAGGKEVWDDYRYAKEVLGDAPHRVMAVNAVGMYVPDKLHYWFGLHLPRLNAWKYTRRIGQPNGQREYDNPQLISVPHLPRSKGLELPLQAGWEVTFSNELISECAKYSGACEDSGFMAMVVAIAMGFKEVWLVGMPGDFHGHCFDPDWKYTEKHIGKIQQIWKTAAEAFPILKERVRSASGITKDLFGDVA